MARVNLTDRTVAAAKAESGERLELWDEKTPGLHLRVTDRGVKTWVVRYRTPDGRQPRLTIGKLPTFGLKDARERAGEVLREVARGGDPATAKRKAKIDAQGSIRTFDELADLFEARCASGEWMPKGKRKKSRTLEDEKGVLTRHIRPTFGPLPYATIAKAEVRALLRKMTLRGIGAQANRTHALIRQVFNFAIAEDLMVVNPTVGVPQPAPVNSRGRVWTDGELKALWHALSNPETIKDEDGKRVAVGDIMCLALKVAAMVGQRRAEVIGMEVSELDLVAKTWRIPAARMKGNRDHLVPLSDAAVTLIEKAISLANEGRDRTSAFVFRTAWTDGRAIQPGSMSRAMRRITGALKIKNATVHDLRRTMSTVMTSERLRVSPFIRSQVLAHATTGGGAAVSTLHYDANAYVSERRDALDRWSNLLLEIVGERKRPSNVTALREAVA